MDPSAELITAFSHKTVFVLDHGVKFAQPCVKLDFDFYNSRFASSGGKFTPIEPVYRSVWTCVLEGVFEYCRIVWDIFPLLKLIRFVASDEDVTLISKWDDDDQMLSAIYTGFEGVGKPDEEGDEKKQDIFIGLEKALELLTEMTFEQSVMKEKIEEEGSFLEHTKVTNRGRIVCLTQFNDEKDIKELTERIKSQFDELNKKTSANDKFNPIDELEIEFLHCYTDDMTCNIEKTTTRVPLGDKMSYMVYTANAAQDIYKKMLFLVLQHYGLASTTVTGIPMKEEQNASTSANYDVELFHVAMFTGDPAEEAAQTQKEGCEYKTITLKWCTPRGASLNDVPHCVDASRISPTDVNSRPSSCLTNFLLSGRCVMLEMPRSRSGGKAVTHMLTSHGSEIFIHSLFTGKSMFENISTSITESAGGKVTDYRINDLAEIFEQHRVEITDPISKIEEVSKSLNRTLQYFPLTMSSTTIFNMSVIDPLKKIIVKEEITEEEVTECRKVIYSLLQMESRSDPLPVPPQQLPSGKTKLPKKDEQYKIMFSELEHFLSCHTHSDRHIKVLDCLLEVRNKPPSDKALLKSKMEEEKASKKLPEFNLSNDGVLRSKSESPMSPTSASPKPLTRGQKSVYSEGKSLLQIVTSGTERENSLKHVPFHGMRNLGEQAKLYLNLEQKAKEANESMELE